MQSGFEREIAGMIVETLNLEGIEPARIPPDEPLFRDGLGLDSIDALELALEISGRYGVQLKAEDENNRQIFRSLRALAAYIEERRGKEP
jgi:acyl carrier protein